MQKTHHADLEVDNMTFMKRALRLAERGRGYVSPNPLVGAVIVKNNKVVGEGFHQKFGEAHAEVNAIQAAGDAAAGATMFVNLEPCPHYGKTGPCTEAILRAGIARVVIGMQDPNPVVAGKGVKFLKSKGISVVENMLSEKCTELNQGYLKFIIEGMPFVTLKIAQTLDGRIATSTGHSRWITSENAREYSHRLRSENDAVLAGINTIITDDPKLTVYLVKGVSPKRIILDSRLRIPLDANILSEELPNKTVVLTTEQASKEKISRIEEKGAMVVVMEADDRGWIPQKAIWKKLADMGITSVLVEGGNKVITECLKGEFGDRLTLFLAPKILGTGIDAVGDLGIRNINSALRISDMSVKKFGNDLLITGSLKQDNETNV
ncbi:bifunctional diaminohydroxyphosphoribosylaminopyrimidine deaminase/5-amino-6-(5-phosphoribosylamino)uracil reductase RibD [candidate division KSB1 bacterium]|nr:bifunctional diaminohydroxyphosphoribosylaminopyrimidine deaminase/5-amino-6-(5-phosphoribosylamino)uracil reductase RibD [candidate division KSB1 bacterium]